MQGTLNTIKTEIGMEGCILVVLKSPLETDSQCQAQSVSTVREFRTDGVDISGTSQS